MGNIVASEAIRLGADVDNYALMQAAVPSAAYDEHERTKATETDFYGAEILGIEGGITVCVKGVMQHFLTYTPNRRTLPHATDPARRV